MKKIILLYFLSFIGTLLFADEIEKTYYFAKPEIESKNEFQHINFQGCMRTAPAGEPAMPYQAVALLLPPGHIATQIEIIPEDAYTLKGTFQIYPMQHAQPVSKGASGIFVKDEKIYTKDTIYPEKPFGIITTHHLHGFAIALCNFTPMSYNPVSGKVSYFKRVKIKITTRENEKSQSALQNLNMSKSAYAQLESLIQNPGSISSYPKNNSRTEDYDLLIITPTLFAAEFQNLEYVYKLRGLRTQVATTEDIYATMPGQDNPEKIRNYIIQEYQSHGIQHLTLGGDVEHVPYRGFYCSVQSSSVYQDDNIPSDLYYAALDGNWNDDGDEFWAEIGEDDLLPEIGVGRMSFSTQAELDAMLYKTIHYQQSPVLGELDKPLLVGEHLYSDPLTWGSDYLELLIGYKDDNGYQTTGIPEAQNIQKLYAKNGNWGENDLQNLMNQGSSFIHHVGHSNSGYAMKFTTSDITNTNFAGINGSDHNFAIIYSHGCICGAFDNNDCIGEKMTSIDSLAAAVYMNSRYGWFNEGQTEGPAAHINRELVDAFYDKKENHLGMALTQARIATMPWVNAPGQWEEGALRWNFYDCNLLGDAALRFWTDEPIGIEANFEDTISSGASSIQISLGADESPEGLICCLIKDSICLGQAQCDANGMAEIFFSEALTVGEAKICISGYNCQLHEYVLQIVQNQQHFQTVWTTPFNPMTFFVQEASINAQHMQAGDEIGIFDSDPVSGNEICVGAGILTEELSGGAYLEITASMDDGSNPDQATGFTPGNQIIYKLWSTASGEVSDVVAAYPYPGYNEIFTSLGTAIVNLSSTFNFQQNILLPSGWSGISSYLLPTNTSMLEILSGISGQIVIITDQENWYEPGNPGSTLQSWDYRSGYRIKVNQNSELQISGDYPQNKSITLIRGWNLISVLSDENILLEVVFSGNMSSLSVIKDMVGKQAYWPSENIWSLKVLQPGRAYLIKVSSGFTISF